MRIILDDGKIAEVIVRKQENLYEYYIEDVRIGVLDTRVMEDVVVDGEGNNILMLEGILDDNTSSQIKEAINKLSREDVELESEITREIDAYIEELGEDDLHVKDIRRISLDDEAEQEEERDPKKGKKKGENEGEKEEGEDEEKEDEEEELGPKDQTVTTSDVNIKQSIELSERANDMHDIRKWLGGRIPGDAKELGVIESDQMKTMRDANGKRIRNNTTRYSLVIINNRGEVEPLAKYIPELEQKDSSGNDPREGKYQVRDDGTVKYDSVLSEYSIGDRVIQIDNNEYGRVEVNIGEEARNSTETMGVQLRDSNTTFVPDTSTRSVMGEYEKNGEDTVEENLREAKKHPLEDMNMDERDVDGEIDTKSHIHVGDKIHLEDGTEMTFDELAMRWGFYREDGKPDSEHAREEYIQKQKEDLEKGPQEVVEELDEQFEDPRVQNQRGH